MTKQTMNFQTETKELLNLMIHSIYTHKEIFLRELISNASDAIDKLKFKSLTEGDILGSDKEFKIEIFQNKEDKQIIIKDNGIGMTYDEVITNIGTIAKSGSKAFTEAMKQAKEASNDSEIIGQFGVGFYSAFMIADKITLKTKSPYSDTAVMWESNGEGEFTISDIGKADRGTEIILHIREDEEKSNDEFLEEYRVKELIKKYSDYVRYPINLEVTKEEKVSEDSEETVTTKEMETLNSMTPIWRKNKNDIEEKEYSEFYQGKFHDWQNPLHTMHFKVEGNVEYTALLFFPEKAPMNFYSKDFEKGLQLYTKNVFIMDKCKELLPDHFRFVKGLVDSSDFSLNISREILQQTNQLKVIAKNIEKKIQKELEKLLKTDREKYINFWKEFGNNIKGGIYESYGTHKDKLKNLLIFKSTTEDKYVTLKEYVERMSEEQSSIYYVAGDSIESLKKMPQLEAITEKGWEVLYFTDPVDEFAIKMLMEFDGKKFKSVHEASDDLVSDDDKKLVEEIEKDNKSLFDKIKESLGDKVSGVKASTRLKSSAVCLTSGEGISFEMEKVMKQMPGADAMGPVKAEKVLEINPNHDLFKALQNVSKTHPEDIKDFSSLLYSQAMLVEGFELEDPIEFANKMAKLMIKASK